MHPSYFPLQEYWWFYLAFTGLIAVFLAVDLGVFHRKAHAESLREAAIWSAVWITLSLAFNYGFYRYALWTFAHSERLLALPGFDPAVAAKTAAFEFLTGYVIEKALSVDNIFVFVVVFGYFGIPAKYQHRVLFFGVIGALFFRAIFIAAGAALIQYHWMLLVFGAFLIVTGFRMMFSAEKEIHPEKNPILRLFRRFVPVTSELRGQRLFVKIGRRLHATPLLVTLIFVEVTDIVFAVDSVPAIFAVTREPMIVFTSNIFAILGLRALYFLLAGAIGRFHLLRYGLALVLIFVGLKMVWLNDLFGGQFPIVVSLEIICGVIGTSIALSLLFPERTNP